MATIVRSIKNDVGIAAEMIECNRKNPGQVLEAFELGEGKLVAT